MENKVKFYQLDPRNTPAAAEANEAIFGGGPVLGIEVTIPALASRCEAGNLDHHGPGDTSETPSASEQAMGWPYRPCCGAPWHTSGCDQCGPEQKKPENPTALVTVRPDADSVTAMAVIMNRLEGRPVDDRLVHAVGLFDRLGPSVGKPAPAVTAIARKACDFKVALVDRVQWVADLLAGVYNMAEIVALNMAHDAELEAARKASELTLHADGRIACVVSTHRFATILGYELAPVVVAQNSSMLVDPKDPSKGVYNKYTVCRYDSHTPCDLPAALVELQALEPGWGGRGDIFGSPQGVSSKLNLDQVVEVVARHLQ